MIKCEVVKDFTLERFDELTNIKRAIVKNKKGHLFTGDTFECKKDLADYLTGGNDKNVVVAKIIEVIPSKKKKTTKRIRKKKV